MTSSSAQLFASVTRKVISENDFLELTLCFKKEMFRLETLDYYEGADDLIHAFMRGEQLPTNPDDLAWYDNIKTKTTDGLSANRVHIVPAQLLSYST